MNSHATKIDIGCPVVGTVILGSDVVRGGENGLDVVTGVTIGWTAGDRSTLGDNVNNVDGATVYSVQHSSRHSNSCVSIVISAF